MRTLLSAFLVFSFFLFLLPGGSSAYEIGTNFEGPTPGFVFDGWGIRDVSTCQWGPQQATSGVKCVGVPEACQSAYPNGNPDTHWEGFFATPEIALDDSFPAMYLRFNHWADWEGVTDTFDGLIVEFINLSRGTTTQIDSAAALELVPTYDAIIGSTNPPLQGLWAYCYDTRGSFLSPLGYPYAVFTYQDPDGNGNEYRLPRHTHAPQQFEWRAIQTIDLIAAGYADQGDTVQIQWHFVSDQLAGGQGYFMDDLFISNTPPSDQQGPIVDVVSPANFADVPMDSVSVQVKAVITDVASAVLEDSVFLVYTIDEGTEETIVGMTSVGADTFMAEVEPLPYDTDVFYQVMAYDTVFNKTTSPRLTFEVTDAVTIAYDDGIGASVFPVPEIGSGFANKFTVPADTMFTLHKVLFYFAREGGLFDVVVNLGTTQPGGEVARYEDVENGTIANTFFQYEVPELLEFQGPTTFWAGMRHVSEDTLLDPQPLLDGFQDFQGVSFRFFGGSWAENTSETMIRVKVKKSYFSGVEGDDVAGGALPKVFALSQNFPNPFNPQTVITYDVPEKVGSGVNVNIDIFNIHGQRVKNLVNETKEPGSYSAQWDGRNELGAHVSSGIYFYRIKAGEFVSTRKMVLLK